MLGSSNRVLLIDLSMLRVGLFKGSQTVGNFETYKFLPTSAWNASEIKNVLPGSSISVPVFEEARHVCPYREIKVLVAGEFGRSPFLEKYILGTNNNLGMLPKMLRQIRDLRDNTEIARAALKTKESELQRGDSSVLFDAIAKAKEINKVTENRFGGFGFNKNKRRGGIY